MKRVFLIEDDAQFARELALGLQDLGYTVGIAEGLGKGVQPDRRNIMTQVEEFAPERVILDLDLGDGNTEHGKRLLSALKQTPKLADTFRCVLSGYIPTEENPESRQTKSIKDELHQRGADLVLDKGQLLKGFANLARELVKLWSNGDEHPPAKLPRVLILEDSEGDIERYRKALKDRAECFYLSPVKPNAELMKAIQDFDPDLIVADLMLGGLKESKRYPGANIIRAIREDSQLKLKPIVVCSKYISPLEIDPEAPGVLRKEIDKALPKFPFPTADDLLSSLHA